MLTKHDERKMPKNRGHIQSLARSYTDTAIKTLAGIMTTRDQDLAAQDAELRAAGCGKVFKEKVSGAKTDRPELAKVIRRLEFGDVLVVTRLDRLARSTRDLLNVLDEIGKRGAGFKSLKDTW